MDILAIKKAADLLKNSSYTFALTGAGISTESGIPDYRSRETGLWQKVDPMKKASLSALYSNPADFYSYNLPLWTSFQKAEPNIAHKILAKLEDRDYIQGIITQNIDSLHFKAGSRHVLEIHGHLRTFRCINCNQKYPTPEVVALFERGINPPCCGNCSSLLRPDVVLFEDSMPEVFARAAREVEKCQLLLVAGTSLRVHPAAGLAGRAKQFLIVNRESTPFDDMAEVVIRGEVGEFFSKLMSVLC